VTKKSSLTDNFVVAFCVAIREREDAPRGRTKGWNQESPISPTQSPIHVSEEAYFRSALWAAFTDPVEVWRQAPATTKAMKHITYRELTER
jgi:hypothetical protein